MPEKLSAKFARQESEEARLARIARRRIREDQVTAVRKMLGLTGSAPVATGVPGSLLCPTCRRRFALPMHLGRHLKAAHPRSFAVSSETEDVDFRQLEHQRREAGDAGQAPGGRDHCHHNVVGQPEGSDRPLLDENKD